MYNQAAPLLRTPGHRIIERAALKGTVGGDVGMQRLFEPAMLLSLVSSPHTLYEMASVAKDIPFIGNFNQWLPASATIAAAYRALVSRNDSRARDVELWLSLPENGGMPGPPVIHQAMTNRLSGLLVNQIRSDTYRPPLTLPQILLCDRQTQRAVGDVGFRRFHVMASNPHRHGNRGDQIPSQRLHRCRAAPQ